MFKMALINHLWIGDIGQENFSCTKWDLYIGKPLSDKDSYIMKLSGDTV